MKVGVDGVLLGAWVDIGSVSTALDVGTGTGLIALMLAQRMPQAQIDAVEIETAAYEQALSNVHDSPWRERVRVLQADFLRFSQPGRQAGHQAGYDLIVSNPPYFIGSLKSPDQQRTAARHSDSLPHVQLIENSIRLLRPFGRLAVILPVVEARQFAQEAQWLGLHCVRRLSVQARAEKPVYRILSEWAREPSACSEQALCIEAGLRHCYTAEYEKLTKDFYLDKADRPKKER